jgi:hypothetical protein
MAAAMSSDESPDTEDLPKPPPEVSELSAACLGYVRHATGMELDFTTDTLPILDHYIRQTRGDAVAKPEIVEMVASAIGAYLGEVTRQKFGGSWFAPPGEYRRWRVELEHVFLSMNPIGVAMEAMLVQAADGWGAHFRLRPDDERKAEALLANLPPVDEDQYYAPSSRLEALEIVVEGLLRGVDEPRKYGPSDYGPFRAEAIGEALDKGGGTH